MSGRLNQSSRLSGLVDERNELVQIELNAVREALTREVQRTIEADWLAWEAECAA